MHTVLVVENLNLLLETQHCTCLHKAAKVSLHMGGFLHICTGQNYLRTMNNLLNLLGLRAQSVVQKKTRLRGRWDRVAI